MRSTSFPRLCRETIELFPYHCRGAVAVEFAFVVPVMLALLFCGYETSSMASAFMRLSDTAQMMADLVSRRTSVTTAQISDFCSGIRISMRPFSTDGYSATVASVTRSASGLVVDWQDTTCGNGQPIASAEALAGSYVPGAGNSVIVVQASYTFHPLVNTALSPNMLMVRTGYARSRSGATVSHN